jgi:hypothetical protein
LLTTAAVRNPAEAQTTMPATSPGTTDPEACEDAELAGDGARGAGGATAFEYAFEVVLLWSGGNSAWAEAGGAVCTRAFVSKTVRSRAPQTPDMERPYCCWSFSTAERVAVVNTLRGGIVGTMTRGRVRPTFKSVQNMKGFAGFPAAAGGGERSPGRAGGGRGMGRHARALSVERRGKFLGVTYPVAC